MAHMWCHCNSKGGSMCETLISVCSNGHACFYYSNYRPHKWQFYGQDSFNSYDRETMSLRYFMLSMNCVCLTHWGRDKNGRHFADDIFKCIFLDKNVWIPIRISLKFVPRGPSNNIPAFIQIMAWRRPGNKPLSEAMMVSLPTHICSTRPQWDIAGSGAIMPLPHIWFQHFLSHS